LFLPNKNATVVIPSKLSFFKLYEVVALILAIPISNYFPWFFIGAGEAM
jgi:hypothetical protein